MQCRWFVTHLVKTNNRQDISIRVAKGYFRYILLAAFTFVKCESDIYVFVFRNPRFCLNREKLYLVSDNRDFKLLLYSTFFFSVSVQRSHETSSNLSKYNVTNIRELLSMIFALSSRTSFLGIDCRTCKVIDYTGFLEKRPGVIIAGTRREGNSNREDKPRLRNQ